jgi:hypothetical protein
MNTFIPKSDKTRITTNTVIIIFFVGEASEGELIILGWGA